MPTTEPIALPNGLTVEAPSRDEAAFPYEEIFNSDAYLRHGIDVPTAPRWPLQ